MHFLYGNLFFYGFFDAVLFHRDKGRHFFGYLLHGAHQFLSDCVHFCTELVEKHFSHFINIIGNGGNDIFATFVEYGKHLFLCRAALALTVIVNCAVLLGNVAKFGKQTFDALTEIFRNSFRRGNVLFAGNLQFFIDRLLQLVDLACNSLIHSFEHHCLTLFVSFCHSYLTVHKIIVLYVFIVHQN